MSRVIDKKSSIGVGKNYSRNNPIMSALMSMNSGAQTKLYSAESYMYRCVNLRAATLASMPWRIERISDGETVATSEDQAMPLELSWLGNFYSLLYVTEADLSLFNQGAYWYKVRNAMGIKEIKRLLPSSVSWQQVGMTDEVEFNRISSIHAGAFDSNDVVYFWRYNAMSELGSGTCPAHAALSDSGLLYSVNQFAIDFFDRGAIKGTLLTVDGNAKNPEIEKLEKWWQSVYSGLKKSWQTAAVRAGVNVVKIGEGIGELSNTNLTTEKREAITTAFGTPDSLVMSNASTFATAQQDVKNFYTQTMIPEFLFVAGIANEQLLEPEGYRLILEAQKIPELQEDEEERAASFVQIVNGLAIAKNNGINPIPVFEALGMTVPTSNEQPLFLFAPQPEQEVIDVTPTEIGAEEKSPKARNTVYVALGVPDAVASDVHERVGGIEGSHSKESYHITLSFLGKMGDFDTESIRAAVKSFSNKSNPIKLSLGGIQRFRNGRDKDPISLTVHGDEINKIHEELHKELANYGISNKSEFDFSPHMTIAHIDSNEETPSAKTEKVDFVADTIKVFFGNNEVVFSLSNGTTDDTADLRAWQRKATKRLKRGKNANAPFDSDTISANKHKAIAELLKEATTKEEIDAAFAAPFRSFAYP